MRLSLGSRTIAGRTHASGIIKPIPTPPWRPGPSPVALPVCANHSEGLPAALALLLMLIDLSKWSAMIVIGFSFLIG